jgi:3-methyl-2-oxobutanoate hydroxymethyltransferase
MGKTAAEALKITQDAKDLENAGAAFLEVEVVTVELADYITRNTPLITMGMGCGDVCDTQYLFSSDVLGTNSGHYPRHSKKYADFISLESELQRKRVEAFQAFITDVDTGIYPEEKHQLHMSEAEFNQFIESVN